MMKMDDVVERVRSLVAETLFVEVGMVSLDSRLREDLAADDLELMELVAELEDRFEMEIPEEQAEALGTVGEVVAYILSKSRKVLS